MQVFSFDKQANNYLLHSSLQNKIAKYLIAKSMNSNIHSILDLGSGSGNIIKNLANYKIDYFLGIDNSLNMLSLHPKIMDNINTIELLNMNFDHYDFDQYFDLIISSSSLHWSRNIESIFLKLKNQNMVAFSIFTNKSLESLHNFIGSKSPLKSYVEFADLINQYFIGEFERMIFKEEFNNKEELLKHLKYNGLLGGGGLSFRSKKKLKFEFSNLSLEYEVLFFIGKVK